jgi:two-component system response regulator AtoC
MNGPRIVVCDDERLIRLWLVEHLTEAGYRAEAVGTGAELLARVADEPTDLVLLDLRLPDTTGLDLLPRIREIDPRLPVIMITAYGEVETAVQAVRAGAHHFLEKPIELPELRLLMDQALESRRMKRELERYRDGNRWRFADVSLVGRSLAMQRVAELVTRLAGKTRTANVLIRGESGTGKGVVARAIHARGPRADRPFVAVNCTALPEHLVESELFGHEAGAFTDAREAKKGLLEIADGGTVFLDEVGDMPRAAQAKVLGFLESQVFRRVGGVRDIRVDVHVIAATNRDIEFAVAEGSFREDLFYRLNVVPIEIPPLRERPEDIAPLVLHLLETLCREMGHATRGISDDAMRLLESHDWPGNVRELRNALERVLLMDDTDPLLPCSLPAFLREIDSDPRRHIVLPPEGLSLDELERELMCQALERTRGNKTLAARLLGLSRDTLRYRLDKFGIS